MPSNPIRPALPSLSADLMQRYGNVRFVDIEASGLDEGSYPTEFGICDLGLNATSLLIRPRPEWDGQPWSLFAEEITGLSKAKLEAEGVDAEWVMREVGRQFKGCAVYSDNPEWDAYWISRLQPDWKHEGIRSLKFLEEPAITELVKTAEWRVIEATYRKAAEMFPHLHRAEADAVRMAALFRILVDAEFRNYVNSSSN